MTRISAFTGGFSGYRSVSRSFIPVASGGGEYDGSIMLFAQSAAPTGWTKMTTYDDYALRVVSGSTATGGTVNFSTVHTTQTSNDTLTVPVTTGATTLSTTTIPSHTHGTQNIKMPNSVYLYYAAPYTTVFFPMFTETTDTNEGINSPQQPVYPGYSTTFGGASHTHPDGTTSASFSSSLNFGIQYQDIILAQRTP